MPNSEQIIGMQKNPDAQLRELLRALLKHPSKSRENIADELSLHAGQRISKYMLDDWARPGKAAARFPAFLIEALCEVVGNDALQRHVMGARLRGIVDLRDEQIKYLAECVRLELLQPRRKAHARHVRKASRKKR
jgi:hypothetical protein